MKKSRKIISGITVVSLIAGMCVIPAVAPEMPVTAYAEDILQDAENTEVPSTTEVTTTIQSATESTTAPQTSERTESIQTTTESTTALQTSETTEAIQTATKNIETISQNVKSTNKQLSDMIDMSAEYGYYWHTDSSGSRYIYNMTFEGNNLKIETPYISPQETIQFEIGEMTGDNTFSLINGNMQLGEGDYITNQTGTLKVIDYNTIQIDFVDSKGFYTGGFSGTFVNVAPKATTTTKSTTTTATTTTVTVATAGTATVNSNSNGWQSAYKEILEKYISDGVTANAKFSLCYVDNDDIPELIVHSNGLGMHADTDVYLYTFYNGKVYDLGRMCDDGYTTFSYYEKSGVIITGWMNQGVEQRSIYKLANGSVSLIDSYSSDAEIIRDIGQYSLTKGNISTYLPVSSATTATTKAYPSGTTTAINPSGNNGTTTALSGGAENSGTTASGSSQPENNSNNNSSNSNSNSNSSSSDSTGKSSPKTSDAGVGIAVTGIAVAMGMAFVARKKKD